MAVLPPHLAAYTEEERADALIRFSIIRPFFEYGIPLAHLANDHNMQPRTVQRWAHRYQQSGLVGLVRQRRGDRGTPRDVVMDQQLLIEGLAL